MKPDYDSLINAGLSKEEIAKISGCEKQQSLDAIDYMICKIKNNNKWDYGSLSVFTQ